MNQSCCCCCKFIRSHFFLLLYLRTPSGLEDVSRYPALFASLLASGTWSLEDLKKLAGLNFLRVLREVERVSKIYLPQICFSTPQMFIFEMYNILLSCFACDERRRNSVFLPLALAKKLKGCQIFELNTKCNVSTIALNFGLVCCCFVNNSVNPVLLLLLPSLSRCWRTEMARPASVEGDYSARFEAAGLLGFPVWSTPPQPPQRLFNWPFYSRQLPKKKRCCSSLVRNSVKHETPDKSCWTDRRRGRRIYG